MCVPLVPIDERFLLQGQQAGLQTAQTFGFPTVALGKDDSRTLSVVNAVSAGYPLRGKVLISDSMFAGSYEATAVPEPGAAWAEPGLMARLDLDIGDTVKLGSAEFRLTKVLDFRPDQSFGFLSLAPAILVNIADVPAMQVVRTGSRVTYRQLFAGRAEDIESFRRSIAGELGLRAYLGPCYMSGMTYVRQDRSLAQHWDEPRGLAGLAQAVRFIEDFDGSHGGLVRGMLAPDRIETCTPALLARTAAASRARQRGSHHLEIQRFDAVPEAAADEGLDDADA